MLRSETISARTNLPEPTVDDIGTGAAGLPLIQSRRAKIRRLIAHGYTVDQVVTKLAKDDEKKAQNIRFQISKMIAEDEAMQLALGMGAKGSLVLDLPETAQAVGRRAKKGNVPAAKLLFESSGFWSPRTQHQHTGEIKITMTNAPRPTPVEDDVVDAEVVEDD